MNNKFASWGIPSELQIQRHPRICHWKYLQHASMETECLLSCQLVLVLELLVLFIRWLLPWWGSLSDAHACNAELTVRSCVEEKVWTVQNVNETWWASSILFSSHLKQILGLRGLWSFFWRFIWFGLIRGCAWLYTGIGHHVGVHRSQKKSNGTGVTARCDPLCGCWGTEPRSSAAAAGAFNSRAIFPGLVCKKLLK